MKPQRSPDQLTSELTQAFDRLPILDGQKEYLSRYIQFLAERMNEVVHLPYPNNFVVKASVVIPELRILLGKAVDLEGYLSQIHQSTILAIPDTTARGNLQLACKQIIHAVNDVLQSVPENIEEQSSNTGGRTPKFRAFDLAKSLAGNYQQLTGKTPTITVDPISDGNIAKGDFLKLVHDVFEILGVEGSPEYFAKRAIEHFNSQKDITPFKS